MQHRLDNGDADNAYGERLITGIVDETFFVVLTADRDHYVHSVEGLISVVSGLKRGGLPANIQKIGLRVERLEGTFMDEDLKELYEETSGRSRRVSRYRNGDGCRR